MSGLMRIWKMVAIKAEKLLSKAHARTARDDQALEARAIRLLRKGAISRAGKTIESDGLGDTSDPAIPQHLKGKFPTRGKEIHQEIHAFQPDYEIKLKVEKFLVKVDFNAAPGLSGLRYGHLRMWIGAFAPSSGDAVIEHLDTLVSDMANDKLPPRFMHAMQGADLLAIVKKVRYHRKDIGPRPSGGPQYHHQSGRQGDATKNRGCIHTRAHATTSGSSGSKIRSRALSYGFKNDITRLQRLRNH